MKTFIPLVSILLLSGCLVPLEPGQSLVSEAEQDIRSLLVAQQEAWNRGSIDEFLEGYLESEELTFISGANVQRGFQETRERYHSRYGGDGRMGQLSFTELETRVLTRDAALCSGAWRLTGLEDDPNGRFTLLLRRIAGDWKIVLDHTSSAVKPE